MPLTREPTLRHRRSYHSEKPAHHHQRRAPAHHNWREACTATWHSRKINKNKVIEKIQKIFTNLPLYTERRPWNPETAFQRHLVLYDPDTEQSVTLKSLMRLTQRKKENVCTHGKHLAKMLAPATSREGGLQDLAKE